MPASIRTAVSPDFTYVAFPPDPLESRQMSMPFLHYLEREAGAQNRRN
jgi:hypothetical protein